MMRCHNIMDRGLSIHIPGCDGCAAMGHHRCTCNDKPAKNRLDELEKRVERLERLAKVKTRRAKQ